MKLSHKFKKQLSVFIAIYILSTYTDETRDECKNLSNEAYVNNIVHHIISNYLWFGSFIFGHYIIHLIIKITILAGWTYFGHCFVTSAYNNICGLPNNNNHKDLIYKITSFNIVNHYTLIKFVIAYDLYKIFIDY